MVLSSPAEASCWRGRHIIPSMDPQSLSSSALATCGRGAATSQTELLRVWQALGLVSHGRLGWNFHNLPLQRLSVQQLPAREERGTASLPLLHRNFWHLEASIKEVMHYLWSGSPGPLKAHVKMESTLYKSWFPRACLFQHWPVIEDRVTDSPTCLPRTQQALRRRAGKELWSTSLSWLPFA